MIDPGLTGKTAIVTGIDNPLGIGWAIAQALAVQGVRVLGTYFERAQAAEIEARAAAVGTAAHHADLREVDVPAEIFDRAEALFGPADILVNNACSSGQDSFVPHGRGDMDWAERPLETITAESYERHFAVDSRAPALMMAEFARRHAARSADWGRIINLTTAGARAFPGEISYGAAKLSLESYTRAAALELGRYGITANAISPGPTQTGWLTEDLAGEIGRTIPLGRVGRPDDIAGVAIFLASEQARWVTGQIIGAGGGHRV